MAGCKLNECVLVDDSMLNTQGGIREGMHGIHVKFRLKICIMLEILAKRRRQSVSCKRARKITWTSIAAKLIDKTFNSFFYKHVVN